MSATFVHHVIRHRQSQTSPTRLLTIEHVEYSGQVLRRCAAPGRPICRPRSRTESPSEWHSGDSIQHKIQDNPSDVPAHRPYAAHFRHLGLHSNALALDRGASMKERGRMGSERGTTTKEGLARTERILRPMPRVPAESAAYSPCGNYRSRRMSLPILCTCMRRTQTDQAVNPRVGARAPRLGVRRQGRTHASGNVPLLPAVQRTTSPPTVRECST